MGQRRLLCGIPVLLMLLTGAVYADVQRSPTQERIHAAREAHAKALKGEKISSPEEEKTTADDPCAMIKNFQEKWLCKKRIAQEKKEAEEAAEKEIKACSKINDKAEKKACLEARKAKESAKDKTRKDATDTEKGE